MNKEIGYTLRCGCHNYVTLEYDGKLIFCLDNDMHYAEEIIYMVESRTNMRFIDIPIMGRAKDFDGLRFFNGGWKRKFWEEFPEEAEIQSFMALKRGHAGRR